MKIGMYLGTSKYWWAYLALQSNAAVVALMDRSADRAVLFDDVTQLELIRAKPTGRRQQYFYVFWDGMTDASAMEHARSLLGDGADLTALVVGDFPRDADHTYSFYAEGPLRFDVSVPRFDARTTMILIGARLKTWAMPLKNILQSRSSIARSLHLLLGRKRVVFCGSYGTIPSVIRSLCERHGVDVRSFDGYEYYSQEAAPSLEMYMRYVQRDGTFLAGLYDRGDIDAAFFHSAVHLLGREYFMEKIRSKGMALFANGYATGINVNVYTTPFYSQHVFLDFGSVAGTGTYPRLADLQYFGKTFVEIRLSDDGESAVEMARSGSLAQYFDALWERYAPRIEQAMSEGPNHG